MLLAIDVGNTSTMLGLFRGRELLHHWRVATRREGTTDEYGILVKNLFEVVEIPRTAVTGVIMASVVPPLQPVFEEMVKAYFHVTPVVVGPGIRTGMSVLYDSPREVGADRIVNAIAAYETYGGPAIVVDFGTATTFDAISAKGEYLGGVIAPGIGISSEALFERAAKLPRVEIVSPKGVIGKTTVGSMQSGLFYGYIGLVDGIVRRMVKEMEREPVVIGTGGMAHLILAESETVQQIDPFLTLKGLQILYERNR
ncbi:MAG: type III pantothenate kinase [Candidatus Methylomirabilales bacterium]